MTHTNNPLFEEALKIAERECTLPYYDSKPENIYALIQFGNDPLLRPRIISFLSNSFDLLRKVALDKKLKEDSLYTDGYESPVMVNHVIFGALGRAAGMLNANELAPRIYEEFIGLKRVHYEHQIERGTMAIALSILGYEGDLTSMQHILDKAVSNAFNIIEQEDILKMLYAFCLLKKDKTRLLEYLAHYKYTKYLSLVAAALADLDVKEALPILKDRILHLNNPVEEEAFLEAIQRLELQQEAPTPFDRMIWMFGTRNSTEMALGREADNVFIIRARKKTGNEEFGSSFE